EYALAHGTLLRGLIVANTMASIPAHNASLIPRLQRELDVPLDHPEVGHRYLAKYLCRQLPWPDFVTRAFAQTNPQVARPLRGTDPLLIGGELANWDRVNDLPRVSTPTLVVHGALDTADLDHMRGFAESVKHGSFLLCRESRHLPMLDEP